jgi:hypothetical protein
MKTPSANLSPLALVMFTLALLAGFHSTAQVRESQPPAAKPTGSYTLNAGGPHTVVQLTNSPASNPVSVTYVPSEAYDAVFRLTNREPQNIMIWNVRVQVKVQDGGTDGQGWKTVHDDYPTGNKLARIPSGGVDQVTAPRPAKGLWRVCVLYSKERKIEPNPAGRREYTGNFEVISAELNEP